MLRPFQTISKTTKLQAEGNAYLHLYIRVHSAAAILD